MILYSIPRDLFQFTLNLLHRIPAITTPSTYSTTVIPGLLLVLLLSTPHLAEGEIVYSDSNEVVLDLRTQAFKDWLAIYYSSEEVNDAAYGSLGSDGDKDGYNNQFEYLADTDPSDFWSVFEIFFFIDETISLRVSPPSERAGYLLSYSNDLELWQTADSLLPEHVGDELIFDISGFPDSTFFRIILYEP